MFFGVMLRFVLFVILSAAQIVAGTVTISLPAPHRTWKSPGRAVYYVDSLHGNDTNDGLSEARPWRSLNHINAGEFAAGDRILLWWQQDQKSFRWTAD